NLEHQSTEHENRLKYMEETLKNFEHQIAQIALTSQTRVLDALTSNMITIPKSVCVLNVMSKTQDGLPDEEDDDDVEVVFDEKEFAA
ncbi:UNVERIFIED_CONTAM: hypothetical protein ITH96_25305, partial [Salmonella enterica subsp. enterica serovar Weltevreden]